MSIFQSSSARRRAAMPPSLSVEHLEDRLLLDAAGPSSSLQTLLAGLNAAGRARAEAVLAQLGPLDIHEQAELRVSSEGELYHFDPAPEEDCDCIHEDHDETFDPLPPSDEQADEPFGPDGPSGPDAPINEVPTYHSLPGATQKVYLDFNGHTVVGTSWNSLNNGNPIHAPAYDIDGNIFDFNATELQDIYFVWQRVAEDFAPFQLDVTTEEPPAADFTAGKKALRVLISTDVDDTRLGGTGNRWYSGAGGVAYIGAWTATNATPVWVFENNLGNGDEKNVSEAASHEAGHAFGLGHDGRISPSETYYYGHGSGDTGWAPLMGVGYNRNLSQWSKGEYLSANNPQDDLAVIASTSNNVTYRVDEDGSSPDYPTVFAIAGPNVSAAGIITTRADVDVYAFETQAGTVTFHIDPWQRGPNLDILAELYDRNGMLLASNNPANSLDADITVTVSAGTHYLHASGVGKGDPLGTGYTDYGSLGQYTITGTIVPGLTGVPAPSGLTAVEVSTSQIDLNWLDNATNETGYVVQRSPDGAAWSTIATLPAGSTAYSATGLISATLYYFRVRAFNALTQSPYTAPVSALTQGTAPNAPSSLAAVTATANRINLTWTDNSDNETSFTVQRSPNGTSSWTTVATLPANTVAYASDGLNPFTTYFYRVNASNLRGTSGYSNTASATTLDGVPVAPTNFTATALSATSARLNWNDASNNETGFVIELFAQETGGGGGVVLAHLAADTTTYTVTGLTPGTFYSFRIAAEHPAGNSVYTYTYVGLPEPPPSDLVAAVVSSSQINLTWADNSTREQGFNIDRSPDGTSWAPLAMLPANTISYANSGLSPDTLYYYRVSIPGGPGGQGLLVLYSNVASARTLPAGGGLEFSEPASSVNESAGTATITVTRFGGTVGTVTVRWTAADGTATAGVDYTAVSGTLTFAPGQTSATFAIPLIDDNAYEGDETVLLSLSDPMGGAALGSVATAVLTIGDNDPEPLRVTTFTPTSTGFIALFNRPADVGQINLYDVQGSALGPADVTLLGAAAGPVRGSLVFDAAGLRATFIRTGGELPADTYTATFRSAGNGFRTTTGILLDGNNDGLPGDDHVRTFTRAPSTAVTVRVPDFLRGPGQVVNLPLGLSDGAGVTSISLDLTFAPALLNITAAGVGSGLPAGAAVTLDTSTSGRAIVNFTSPTALGPGPIDFVILTARIPDTAPYTSKHVLDLGNVRINGGAISAGDDDGLHVVGYPGDTTGNAAYSSVDAVRALRVAVGLDSGFLAYQLADPVLIADVSGDGRIGTIDATHILQEAVGIDRPEIPPLPGVIPPIVPGGPDPLLSIPKTFAGRPGDTITVPVNLDISDGLQAVDLALAFDPSRLEVRSEGDVRPGTLTSDFELFLVHLDPVTGTLRVGLASLRAEGISGRGAGSVLEIDFHVKPNAPAGLAVINLLHDLGPTHTQLNEGGLVLNPAPSNAAGDALDGVIKVRTARVTLPFRTVVPFPSDLASAIGFQLPASGRRPTTDGRYPLTSASERIIDRSPRAADEERDGRLGGVAVEQFFRRYGDGDRDVDALDRAAFLGAWSSWAAGRRTEAVHPPIISTSRPRRLREGQV